MSSAITGVNVFMPRPTLPDGMGGAPRRSVPIV